MNKELNARELAEMIQTAKQIKRTRAVKSLREKCKQHVSVMAAQFEFNTYINLDNEELKVLNEVTEEMREQGYRYRLIEKSDGSFQLFVTIEHCLEGL